MKMVNWVDIKAIIQRNHFSKIRVEKTIYLQTTKFSTLPRIARVKNLKFLKVSVCTLIFLMRCVFE
jgi:hypothetical protein